ncbi:MAG: ASCH domain-containing protein [Bacteroidales bacterium]|nr:ASCH domain-containing protein [Bacteroidales bacterium]MBR3414309.1 ASCH domain-containing protein [Bacteroidales bacterium]
MRVLLSIKPEFVSRIFDGSKKYEFRKSLFKRRDVTTVVIYASNPVKLVVGEFEIKAILSDDVDALWSRTSDHSGISKDYYDSYFEKRETANAIQIGKLKRYKTPKRLADINVKQAPQSFCYLQ